MMKNSYSIILVLALLGLAGCPRPPKLPDPKLSPGASVRPCPGTAAKVRDNCGCNPIDNSLITVVETLQINQSIKSRVQSCAEGKFGIDVTSAVIATPLGHGKLTQAHGQGNQGDAGGAKLVHEALL